jgi:hypothetical protein
MLRKKVIVAAGAQRFYPFSAFKLNIDVWLKWAAVITSWESWKVHFKNRTTETRAWGARLNALIFLKKRRGSLKKTPP